MKFIDLTQAKIEGETEPRVLRMGRLHVRPDEVVAVHSICDKFDRPVKGVSRVFVRNMGACDVAETTVQVLEMVNGHVE